jgi:hypothetical protein
MPKRTPLQPLRLPPTPSSPTCSAPLLRPQQCWQKLRRSGLPYRGTLRPGITPPLDRGMPALASQTMSSGVSATPVCTYLSTSHNKLLILFGQEWCSQEQRNVRNRWGLFCRGICRLAIHACQTTPSGASDAPVRTDPPTSHDKLLLFFNREWCYRGQGIVANRFGSFFRHTCRLGRRTSLARGIAILTCQTPLSGASAAPVRL